MAKKHDIYMPLIVGDWLKGTRGMRAETRGIYLSLLLYQWDNGFIPSDPEELALIEPEIRKWWDKLKEKFTDFGTGKLRNEKLEEVRAFFSKQVTNGKKGGRPKNPTNNPNRNPKQNPNPNLHNEVEVDVEYEFKSGDNQGDARGIPPSQAMVTEQFVKFGLDQKEGESWYDWVQGKHGWDKINSWQHYTAVTIAKKLEEKKGKNGKQQFGSNLNLDELEKSTNDWLSKHHGR